MNWIAPVLADVPRKRVVLRYDGAPMPSTAREIVIDGVRYESIYDAMRRLGCSACKVYRLMGEGWRCR